MVVGKKLGRAKPKVACPLGRMTAGRTGRIEVVAGDYPDRTVRSDVVGDPIHTVGSVPQPHSE